jgi:hypothetical protein
MLYQEIHLHSYYDYNKSSLGISFEESFRRVLVYIAKRKEPGVPYGSTTIELHLTIFESSGQAI